MKIHISQSVQSRINKEYAVELHEWAESCATPDMLFETKEGEQLQVSIYQADDERVQIITASREAWKSVNDELELNEAETLLVWIASLSEAVSSVKVYRILEDFTQRGLAANWDVGHRTLQRWESEPDTVPQTINMLVESELL